MRVAAQADGRQWVLDPLSGKILSSHDAFSGTEPITSTVEAQPVDYSIAAPPLPPMYSPYPPPPPPEAMYQIDPRYYQQVCVCMAVCN